MHVVLLSLAVPYVLASAFGSWIPSVSSTLQNILRNTDKSTKYQYPTDFTRGIQPKAIHSHNDYWRDVPFYTALSHGAISTEADVWLINGTLYVGHERSALTSERTLQSLYLDPLIDTLKRQNPSTPFARTGAHIPKNGVFDEDYHQTLYFFIDLKTAGPETWEAVISALEPLRSEGYLSTYDGTNFLGGPVTVIGTGNTPLSLVQNAVPRWAFYDAPLSKLDDEAFSNLTRFDAPIASTNFEAAIGKLRKAALSEEQLESLRAQVKSAHDKGIKVRYWNEPRWPVSTRNAVWRAMWDEGVDLLNADDVAAAAEMEF